MTIATPPRRRGRRACRDPARISCARLVGTPFDRAWSLALAHHARRMADPFVDERATTTAPAGWQ